MRELFASSWGLSLFVLFEQAQVRDMVSKGSWGLSLFVLFELHSMTPWIHTGSWGLSLFVLFEHSHQLN